MNGTFARHSLAGKAWVLTKWCCKHQDEVCSVNQQTGHSNHSYWTRETPHILVARRRSVQASMHVSGPALPHSGVQGGVQEPRMRKSNEGDLDQRALESHPLHRTGLAPRTQKVRKAEESIGIDTPIADGASIVALIDRCGF